MADKVYPSAKPAVNGGVNGGGSSTGFPPNKPQLYNNAARPIYRPQPRPPKRRRGCCCSCCLWTALLIVVIIFLAAIAGAVLWVIYRPQRPNFSVSSLQVSEFNLTSSSSQLKSKFNFTLIARNPNKKVVFFYDPVSISLFANGVDVGDGSFPGFVHGTKNTTTMRTVIASSGQSMDTTDVSALRSDLKNQNNLPLKIQLDTKVKVKVGGLKTKKIGIRVTCNGIKLAVPSGKTPTIASSSNVKCKVDLRIKIWKWTV